MESTRFLTVLKGNFPASNSRHLTVSVNYRPDIVWLCVPTSSPNNLEFGYMSFFGKITCEMYDIPSCKQSQQRLQGVWFNFLDMLYA